MYSRMNPNGVETVSTVPFPEDKWWDRPSLHLFWSYPSWFSMIASAYGWYAPHRWMKRKFDR